MLKLSKHIVFPKAVFLDENNTFKIVSPRFKSLFEMVHAQPDTSMLKAKGVKSYKNLE